MCQKIREPYFRMIATALIVAFAATANAACTTADTQTMSDCVEKLTLPTDGTKDKLCLYYKKSVACYPKCYCDDDTPAAKNAIAAVEKGYKDAGCSGEAKCGGSENSANSACTTAEAQTMSDCVAKLTMPTNVTAKDEMCPYYKDFMACYPKCYCDDDTPAAKNAIAAVEKGYKDMGCSGEAKCGGSDMKDMNSAGTCASDEATRMSECINMLSLPIDVNKDKSCSFYRGVMGCYPSCYCADTAQASQISSAEKGYKDAGCSGEAKCGGSENSANAACTLAEAQTMSDCVQKLTLPTNGTKDKMCLYYKGMMACYPKCFCDDDTPAAKDVIAAVEKLYKDAGCSGEAKCGGSENWDPTISGSDMKDMNSAGTCASDDVSLISKCVNSLPIPTDGDKAKVCTYYKHTIECYPSCLCERNKKRYKDAGCEGEITCGGASVYSDASENSDSVHSGSMGGALEHSVYGLFIWFGILVSLWL
eukprot:g1403.t1